MQCRAEPELKRHLRLQPQISQALTLCMVDPLHGSTSPDQPACVRRYYAKQEHTGRVLRKLSGQVVKSCTAHMTAKGGLWEQPRLQLIQDLTDSADLHDAYLAQYRYTACKVASSYAHFLPPLWPIIGELFVRQDLTDSANLHDAYLAQYRCSLSMYSALNILLAK